MSCRLPDLPTKRIGNSQNNNVLCGGGIDGIGHSNCMKLTSSGWVTVTDQLIKDRKHHVSWLVDDGIILLGGMKGSSTTEIVRWDGTNETLFTLEYKSKKSCAIPDGDSLVITGGMVFVKKVVRYTSRQGNRELLPDMNEGRYSHGCAAFTKETEKVFMLQITLNLYVILFTLMFQVYLVAGGRTTNEDGSEGVKLDSTELFIGGKWVTVGPLPVAVTGVRGVTLDNTVLMAGSICPIYYQF